MQFGARPLKRAIQNHVEDGICELILGDEVKQGDTIYVTRQENEEHLTFNHS